MQGERVTSFVASQGTDVHTAVAREVATIVRADLAMKVMTWGVLLVGLLLLVVLVRG